MAFGVFVASEADADGLTQRRASLECTTFQWRVATMAAHQADICKTNSNKCFTIRHLSNTRL